MDMPRGTVVSLVDRAAGQSVTIEVDVSATCPRCAAGKGCGAGLLGAGGGKQQLQVMVDRDHGIREGDVVNLHLAPRNILRAASIVYGWPLLGAVLGAAIAYGRSVGDAGTALAALAGLSAGLLLGRWRLRQTSCLRQFVPRVERSS